MNRNWATCCCRRAEHLKIWRLSWNHKIAIDRHWGSDEWIVFWCCDLVGSLSRKATCCTAYHLITTFLEGNALPDSRPNSKQLSWWNLRGVWCGYISLNDKIALIAIRRPYCGWPYSDSYGAGLAVAILCPMISLFYQDFHSHDELELLVVPVLFLLS